MVFHKGRKVISHSALHKHSIQVQIAWGFGQINVVGGNHAYRRGLKLDDIQSIFQLKQLCDSMIHD